MAESAICTIKDLLVKNSLIERKHLSLFTKNPVIVGPKQHAQLSNDDLAKAYFEHCVREIIRDYFTIL